MRRRKWAPSALTWLAPLVMVWSGSALAQAPWQAPPEPEVRPQLPRRVDLDVDNNRIDDRLDGRIAGLRRSLQSETAPGRRMQLAGELAAPVRVELVFDSQVSQKQIDDFVALGGAIDHVYRAVSYGWSGTVPGSELDALAAAMGSNLLVVTEDQQAQLHLDEATRTGRVRPVWARGFAGAANGLSGSSDITIGIVDSGVDDSHPDLSGRNEYWKDYTTDGESTPRDIGQHGSHVAGIALGSGAAFGVGPGTLKYTDSGDLTNVAAGSAFISRIHIAPPSLSVTSNAQFNGGSAATLAYGSGSNGAVIGFQTFNSVNGNSALNLVTSPYSAYAFQHYSSVLIQNSTKSVTTYAVSNNVAGYAAVGDGFNAMRGVAPGAKWAGAKVFTNDGAGSSTTIGAAVDDMVAQRTAHNIKVVNMSLGIIGAPGLDVTLRSKVNTMVNNGIVAVCSAGNDGPGASAASAVDDPGRAALALTVGATNDANALTKYSSAGFATVGSDEDTKPDLLAPGGSDYYSLVLSVDSNDGDTGKPGFADKVANDYLNMKGTSMSAPFAAGSAALVIDALQKSGVSWGFSSSAQPLLVKMLLSASATETNANREGATGNNPTLGRAAAPKDLFEGYGLINTDAAVEAVLQTYSGGAWSGSTECQVPAAECATWYFDRRAWGRRIAIPGGNGVTLDLAVPATADYDLYVYSGTPNAKGNPVILASSTNAGTGVAESLTFTPSTTDTAYLFVKKVSGYGSWSLDSTTASARCGDGVKAPSEACDDGNTLSGDCCSSNCTIEANGSPCNDGLFCTATDSCLSGACQGSGNPCATGPECRNTCSEANGSCVSPAGTSCTADALPCTVDQCDGAGACVHTAGNAGVTCRAASGVCDVAETCSGTATSCPADSFATSAVTCRGSAGVCDIAESCTGLSAGCPADALAPSGLTCRASQGVCDVAESCTGASASCPANTFASNTQVCRTAAGVCDSPETCSGVAAGCPADAYVTATAVCRASSGVCDAAENCTGSSPSCPADSFSPSTTVCRASGGVCDVAEKCSGTAASCPADSFAPSTTTCRAAAGFCDAAESCTGTSATCPANAFEPSSKVCRASAGICDAAESCTGASASCPADSFAASSVVCRASAGACDAQETCSGASASCPVDAFAPSTTVCRTAAGVCDAAETCTGNTASCPADAMAPSTTVCRASAGACDVAETCTGASLACPADSLASSGTVCRVSQGICDVAESCSGASASCPANVFASATVVCRGAAGVCDSAETCSGVAAACPVDSFVTATAVCRASAGVCDPAENCTGSSASCPVDTFASAATVCRTASGICDAAENCTGASASCPADSFASSATVCRAASGVCDVAEFCSGASGSCPANGFASPTQTCRAAAGSCDIAESCTGASASCPADSFLPSSTVCRAAGGVCDVQESCSGTAASCPADAVATVALTCRASAGECDVAETCDGAGKSCPADGFASSSTTCTSDGLPCTRDVCAGTSGACTHPAGNAGTTCRASAGVCDLAETCNGTATTCPADAFAFAETVCRSASGICDVAETCSGASASCPADGVAAATVPCRASAGECDLPETCNGSSKSCPANVLVAQGTGCSNDGNVCTTDACNGSLATCQHTANTASCQDGVFCNGADTCSGGSCSVHAGNPCAGADGDGNCSESCSEDADACTAADANGTPCDDGIYCNGADSCSGGACSVHAGNPCVGPDGDGNCAESCNEAGLACNAADNDGSACDDGLFCTARDTCSKGACVGVGNPCPGADGDGDCTETCDEQANDCSGKDSDGTACDDGLFCTANDQCSNGACVGSGSPCAGPDGDGDCSESCDEATSSCTAADANGASCDDGLYCDGADTCSGGECAIHSGDPCPGADADGDCSESCDEASNACTGNDRNGSACDDGIACTTGDTCEAGACIPANRDCGTCGDGSLDAGEDCDDGNTLDGDCCSSQCKPATNGATCDDGSFCNGKDSCSAGACTVHAGDPCDGPDGDGDCSEACNEQADDCSLPDPNNTTCDDGLFCNGADTCKSGVCSGHEGDPCAGADGDGNCSESCNEGADNCKLADPNGSGCDDGLWCNGGDTCQAGACSTHSGSPCEGPDGDGNCAESCDEEANNCNAADAKGSPCDDGVHCNGADSCQAGTCSVHTGDPCTGPDNDADCAESCNEATDACGAPDPDGSACNDGVYCDGNDTCSGGACIVHGGNPCSGPDGDGNCTETCDEQAGNCLAADSDGSFCDDGDPCTIEDGCVLGSCVGNPSNAPECGGATTTTLPQVICGDTNGDGRITSSDALRALRAAVAGGECPLVVCDFTGDGRVTASDALGILRSAVGQSSGAKCPDAVPQDDAAADPLSTTVTTVSSTSSTLGSSSTTLPASR